MKLVTFLEYLYSSLYYRKSAIVSDKTDNKTNQKR